MWVKVDGELYNLDHVENIRVSKSAKAEHEWNIVCSDIDTTIAIFTTESGAQRYLDALLERLGGFKAEDVGKDASQANPFPCLARGFHNWSGGRCQDCGKRQNDKAVRPRVSLGEARLAAQKIRDSKTVDTQYWPWVIEELCRMVEARETAI